MTMRVVALLGLMSLPTQAMAGSLNPWGTATGDGTVSITQYVYAMPDGELAPSFYGSIGIGDKFDLFAGVGASFRFGANDPGVGPGALELFPRYFFTDNIGVALHALYVPGEDNAVVGPEIHSAWQWGRFAFTGNLGWHPTVASSGFDSGDVYAILAPEYFVVEDRVSFYVEINPGVTTSDPAFGMTFVPGIGLGLGEDSAHGLSVGVQIPVGPDAGAVSGGLWYGTTFDLGRRKSLGAESIASNQ